MSQRLSIWKCKFLHMSPSLEVCPKGVASVIWPPFRHVSKHRQSVEAICPWVIAEPCPLISWLSWEYTEWGRKHRRWGQSKDKVRKTAKQQEGKTVWAEPFLTVTTHGSSFSPFESSHKARAHGHTRRESNPTAHVLCSTHMYIFSMVFTNTSALNM